MQIHTNLGTLGQLRGDESGMRAHVVHAAGGWRELAHLDDEAIRLSGDDDVVTFAGPLDLSVAVEAANVFEPVRTVATASADCGCSHQELWSYEVSVPAGHLWTYDAKQLAPYRMAANRGCRVVIRPRRPRLPTPTQAAADLPCDYAVGNIADTGRFFPSGCEPCGDHPVRPPPAECGPRLDVPIARGGMLRPRFYNGMAIAREDLETELRYLRLKMRLHNRAAGHGVVWGFDVALRGSKVVVGPGYGVDCCGNDLTVTCDYAVPAEVLLRDPAVCRDIQRGRTCFALLLEYVECPEEPRPVHGNGCRPQPSVCEYSRVRESVRLRLVPARQAPETPMARFMATVQELALPAPTPAPATPAPAASVWQPAPPATAVPWQLQVTNPQGSKLLQPSITSAASAVLDVLKPGGEPLDLRIVLAGGTTAVAGTITLGAATAPFTGAVPALHLATLPATPPAGEIRWETRGSEHLRGSFTVQLALERTPDLVGVVREIASDRVFVIFPPGQQPPPGTIVLFRTSANSSVGQGTVLQQDPTFTVVSITANTPVRPNMLAVVPGSARLRVSLPAAPAEIERATTPGLPCCESSCCSVESPPSFADNLRLLVIALTYGKLIQLRAAGGSTGNAAIIAALLAVLRAQLRLAPTRLAEFETAVLELYRAWCAAGLYPGPECDDLPDGVVVGCVQVKAGDLCCLDPLGGRRWVVHQPLIDHWEGQFGIPPLDITANRLFARLCCLSHLPGFGELSAQLPNRGSAASAATALSSGAAAAFAGANIAPMLDATGMRSAALAASAGGADANAAFLQLLALVPTLDLRRVGGLVDLLFCGNAARQDPVGASARNQRVGELVTSSINRMAVRRQPRPLMRATTGDLARTVASLVPATAVVAAEGPLRAALSTAGIATVADLAGRQPEELRKVAGELSDDAIDEASARAEEVVEIAVNAIGEATRALASHGLTSARDLDKPEVAERLAKEVAKRMAAKKVSIDAAALTRAVLDLRRG